MEITEFNIRCYVCWKGFSAPFLSDFSYGVFLFVDYKTYEFRYFSPTENTKVDNKVGEILASNKDLQFEND